MVEFAIVAVLFFGMLFAIVDWSILWWVNVTMQHAVREGARYAVTGRLDMDTEEDQERFRAVIEKIREQSMGLYDDVVSTITVGLYDPATSNFNYSTYEAHEFSSGMFGSAGDTIVISLNCVWRPLTFMVQPVFANGEYSFTVSATMRNELFPE